MFVALLMFGCGDDNRRTTEHPNGQLKSELIYQEGTNKNVLKSVKSWFEDGSMEMEQYYDKLGKLHGPNNEWWEIGPKKSEGRYMHGKQVGIHTEWDTEGIVTKKVSYIYDKKGKFVRWEDLLD